ncbi:MAG: hypothetical protein DRH17_13385 [Deltaproteobacteria bacterium]|nr:MAG: hypothetical protein DRH17_13385 [Deltaproteobacteria bacterium]
MQTSKRYSQRRLGSKVIVIDADTVDIAFQTIGGTGFFEWMLPVHLIAKERTPTLSEQSTLQEMLGALEDVLHEDPSLGGNAIDAYIVRLQMQELPEWERDVLTAVVRIRLQVW